MSSLKPESLCSARNPAHARNSLARDMTTVSTQCSFVATSPHLRCDSSAPSLAALGALEFHRIVNAASLAGTCLRALLAGLLRARKAQGVEGRIGGWGISQGLCAGVIPRTSGRSGEIPRRPLAELHPRKAELATGRGMMVAASPARLRDIVLLRSLVQRSRSWGQLGVAAQPECSPGLHGRLPGLGRARAGIAAPG